MNLRSNFSRNHSRNSSNNHKRNSWISKRNLEEITEGTPRGILEMINLKQNSLRHPSSRISFLRNSKFLQKQNLTFLLRVSLGVFRTCLQDLLSKSFNDLSRSSFLYFFLRISSRIFLSKIHSILIDTGTITLFYITFSALTLDPPSLKLSIPYR